MDRKSKKKCGENLSRFSGDTGCGLACEHLIQQNDLTFRVQCENERVIVRYPMGEISIKTK